MLSPGLTRRLMGRLVRRLMRRMVRRLMRSPIGRLVRTLVLMMVAVLGTVWMSGLSFFELFLVIVEPPVPGRLIVRRMSGGGGIVSPVVSPMVKRVVFASPPLVFILTLTQCPRGSSVAHPSRVLPSLVFQMVQIVCSLLFVTSGLVKCVNGFLWFPAEFLYEISGYQIPRPVETVGAVNPYQASLSLSFQDGGVESLHTGLARHGPVAFHPDLDVTEAKPVTVSRFVVAVCVGQVHDMFQFWSRFLQLL